VFRGFEFTNTDRIGIVLGLDEASTEASTPPGVALADSAPPETVSMGRGPLIAVGALVLLYAVLSHYSNSVSDAKGLAVGLSIGPLLLICLALVFRWAGRLPALLAAVVVATLLYRYLPALEKHYEWLDLVQQCGVYALLAAGFGRSLLPGKVPLCAQLAIKMHGALAPVEIRYMRHATLAWMAFYLALVAAIIILFLSAPVNIWSLFVNFAIYGLILLMVLGDHWLRRKLLPPRPSGGMLGIIQRTLIG